MLMGHSVEGRFPYLDHRVMEFACQVPPRYRMLGLNEKYLLKHTAKNHVPFKLINRPKQPYRAPIGKCFASQTSPSYARELLSEEKISENGYFDTQKVSNLIKKSYHLQGNLISERENMAIVGILSTQLLDHLFIKNFPSHAIEIPKNIRFYQQQDSIT